MKKQPKILREVSLTDEELANLIIKEKNLNGFPEGKLGFSWIFNKELRIFKFTFSEPFNNG